MRERTMTPKGLPLVVLDYVSSLGKEACGSVIRGRIIQARGKSIQQSAIYTALHRLHYNGLITDAGIEPGIHGRRNRKIYAVTDAGREALNDAQGLYQGFTPRQPIYDKADA